MPSPVMHLIAKYALWPIAVFCGVLGGYLGEHIIAPKEFVSFRMLWGALVTGLFVIFGWWISATEFEPFKAGLAKPIICSGLIASVAFPIVWFMRVRRVR